MAIDIIAGDHMQARHRGDFQLGLVDNGEDFFVDLLAIEDEIAPGQIETGHQQVRCTRGLHQVDGRANLAIADLTLVEEQDGALGQRTAGLVQADRRHVRI